MASSPRIDRTCASQSSHRRAERLLRRYLHACGNKRTVGRHRTAAGCGPLGGNDGGVASGAAIGGQEHLILGALHAAIRSVAVRSNDANAERRARRTGIAFRTGRAGRPRITFGPLTLTATHHCASQRHRNEHSQPTHGLPSEEGATGCPISRADKRPTERASRQNAVGDSGGVSYKYRPTGLESLCCRRADQSGSRSRIREWRPQCRGRC